MDENRPMTKKELKALRRLEKLDKMQKEESQGKFRLIILGAGIFLFFAFFGFLIFFAKQNSSTQKPIAFSNNGWTRGPQDAKVTLTEFGDFQCPACKAYEPIVKGVLDAYKNKSLKLVFKHFPLTQAHQNAYQAALAAEAAGAQDKFFEMHDLLYEKQDEWAALAPADAKEKFISYAQSLKLDTDKFTEGFSDKSLEEKINAEQNEGINAGVSGTPTFFIDGKIIENPTSVDAFKKLIDEEFKK